MLLTTVSSDVTMDCNSRVSPSNGTPLACQGNSGRGICQVLAPGNTSGQIRWSSRGQTTFMWSEGHALDTAQMTALRCMHPLKTYPSGIHWSPHIHALSSTGCAALGSSQDYLSHLLNFTHVQMHISYPMFTTYP